MGGIKNAAYFVILGCLLLGSCGHAEKKLLPQSQRLFPISGTDETGSVEQPWLSGHELLHFKTGGRLLRYDLNTKTDTPLPVLTRQVKNSPAFLKFLVASPNSQWVMWGESANNPLFVAAIDGSRRFSWPGNGGMSEPYWCADGHHWLQFLFKADPTFTQTAPKVRWTEVLVHSVDTPGQSQTIHAVPEGLQGLDVLAAVSADEIIARTPDVIQLLNPKPQQMTSSKGGLYFTFEEKLTHRKSQQISVWSLHQSAPLNRWNVQLPERVQGVAVSPDGRWAAWLLSGSVVLHGEKAGRIRSALWISRVDGSRMKEIGFVEAELNTAKLNRLSAAQVQQATDFVPMEFRWSPDDKHVSFLYRRAMWAVQVP